MASWKLVVEDYGKIKSAEIEIAPLTLFVGDNNSGKSYLLALLWGIENIGIDNLLGKDDINTPEMKAVTDWIVKQVDIALEKKEHKILLTEIILELEQGLNNALDRNKNNIVKRIFNSENVNIGKLSMKIADLKDVVICFRKESTGEFIISGEKDARGSLTFGKSIIEDKDYKRMAVFKEIMLYAIYGILLNVPISENSRNGAIYLPAARTGFMLTKDIINKAGRNNTFNLPDSENEIKPFIRPINQFLDIIGDLSVEKTGNEKALELVKDFEREMANGTVNMSTVPNKEVLYIPSGYKKGIPLRLSSAVVTEISPLVLILKHKEYVDRFYYEEPEMCLHPQLQYVMGKMLGRAVNSGIEMVVTTHSDIILQHLNNMIKLPRHRDSKMICEKLGYTERDLLSCEQVKVYQFEAKPRSKSVVKELLCGEEGFAVPTFNNALDKIMEESYEIQG